MEQRSSRSPLSRKNNFRKSNKHKMSVIEITKRGGQLWRGMSASEKSPYIKLARQAPKYSLEENRGETAGVSRVVAGVVAGGEGKDVILYEWRVERRGERRK
ncbi:hypothetical protein JTB14_020323 [Gonioctena quinquepunctata]|nr:hypothetical protein JTB14_020323 [Gonioctena quinquepunctata]